MKKKQNNLYYWLGGIVAVLVIGAAVFSQGQWFQGALYPRITTFQPAPSKLPVTKYYKGSCVVRSMYDNLPMYSDADSGQGYVKMNKGTNFTSYTSINNACKSTDYLSLSKVFCQKYPTGSYQKQIGMYNQDNSYNTTGASSLGANFINCTPPTAPASLGVTPSLRLAATNPAGGQGQRDSNMFVMEFTVSGSGTAGMEGIIKDITFTSGTCTLGKVDLYEGPVLLATTSADGIISTNDFVNKSGLPVRPDQTRTFTVRGDSMPCMADERLSFVISSFMYNDGSGSGYKLADYKINNYLSFPVTPKPFSGNVFMF